VAQVGQVGDVALDEEPAPLERGKDGTEALAVSARVADVELPSRLIDQWELEHAAASLPAIRPQTLPIVIPKPAR